jgi:pyruvate dehydrogenase E2 component (dihydrolipoamide acetyltransferase)
MAVEVVMPKFGLTMNDGIIKRFLKQPGETVVEGEPLFEVETEKVLNEVPSPASGVLVAFLFNEEDTVDCGVVMAIIAQEGDDLEALKSRYTALASPQAAAAPPSSRNDRLESLSHPGQGSALPEARSGGARRPITPIARKRAAELGVDLAKVEGTGPGGRVTREDVERFAASAQTSAKPARPAPVPAPSIAQPGTVIPLKGIRKTIAERMMRSLHESAQLTLSTEADVTPAADLRAQLGREADFTYTDLMVHAVARALRRHPRLNSHLEDGAIRLLEEINIGIAVALDEGLIVPVIRNADRKSLREIAAESKELGARARQGKLRLEDVAAGTFTITNLGTYGVDAFTPIINHGEAAILGLGRIIERPAIYRGEITRRSMMTLSLTFDHRIVDGAPAAEFLQAVIQTFNYGER